MKNTINADAIVCDRDYKDLGWQPLDSFGWGELEPGHIVAVDTAHGIAIGFVASKTETVDQEFNLTVSPVFGSDWRDHVFETTYNSVRVAPLTALVWTEAPLPTLAVAERYEPSNGTFYCRTLDDTSGYIHIPEDRIAFATSDGTIRLEGCDRKRHWISARVKVFGDEAGMKDIKAVADVTIDDELTLRQLRVVDGKNGLYVGYPNDPFYKGEDYRSMFFPVSRELRAAIEDAVLQEYRKAAEA